MSSIKLNYFSLGKTIDGTNYCSGMETLAENMLEDNENDAVLVFPSSTSWAKLRSSAFRMTTDNAEAILPLPIYNIKKILLKPYKEKVKVVVPADDGYGAYNKEIMVEVSKFTDEEGNPFEMDITDMVVSEEEWKALPTATSTSDYQQNIRKDNTFQWKQGSTIIPFVSTVYKIGYTSIFGDESPLYARLKSRLYNKLKNKKFTYTFLAKSLGWYEDVTVTLDDYLTILVYGYTDVRDWQYRIEYVPLVPKTKIRARKSEKQEVEYLQPFNQRAEINAASAFGKNMWITAQKTGTRQITVVKNYTRLADIPPLGALVRHNGKRYRLVANSYKQTNTIYLQVTHTLSENWTSKSKHVSVNQKYRNYNIPQDLLWRNLYWEDYIVVSGAELTGDILGGVDINNIMRLFYSSTTNDKTIDNFCWFFDGNETIAIKQIGATVPCSTYGIANSIIVSASFKDNLSAGLKTVANGEDYLCEETLYCNADGTLENARVILTDGIGNGIYSLANGLTENNAETLEEGAKKLYPAICSSAVAGYTDITVNAPKTALFNRKFYVDKNAGEAIKFTYQIHFVTEGNCVVGNKIAEHNPLIKRYEGNRKLRIWLLTSYIREGVDSLIPSNNDRFFEESNVNILTNYYITINGNNAQLGLRDFVLEELRSGGYKAWAITDENNYLYVGRNENQEGIVHLCISHKRN